MNTGLTLNFKDFISKIKEEVQDYEEKIGFDV